MEKCIDMNSLPYTLKRLRSFSIYTTWGYWTSPHSLISGSSSRHISFEAIILQIDQILVEETAETENGGATGDRNINNPRPDTRKKVTFLNGRISELYSHYTSFRSTQKLFHTSERRYWLSAIVGIRKRKQ